MNLFSCNHYFRCLWQVKKNGISPIIHIEILMCSISSAVVEDRFLSTCRVKFHPDGDNCRQNNGQEINAVMFRPKSKLQITRWIIGTGRVNSGWLSIKHAAALTCSAFRKQSSVFEGLFDLYFVFQMNPFFFKIVHYYVDKTEYLLTCHISQTCCFVANFVDKALVNDSTSSKAIDFLKICTRRVKYDYLLTW